MVKACLAAGANKNIRVNNRKPEDLAVFLNELDIACLIRVS